MTSLSYHPSGKYLVSSSLDSTIKIWDTFNSQILYTVHGHQGPVNCVAFSRDGDYFCSGGGDTTLMVWKNNLSGVGYPKKSKNPENEGLSKPVTIPKKRAKSKTGFKCCKDRINNKNNKSSSQNKFKNEEENKTNFKSKNIKNSVNSKNTNLNSQMNVNIYGQSSNTFNSNINNNTIKSNGMVINVNNSTATNNTNMFVNLPPELKLTFEKLISQLDLVGKTMKIMDQRIQCLEGQISTLYNRQKKGFVQKQPPQLGDFNYLLENSNNFMPNNSINDNEVSQKINNQNNFDYYTADIYNSGANFKETMNLNDENKKNIFKTEIDINQLNKNSLEQKKNEDNYQGQIHEEFGYNGEEEQMNGEEEQVNGEEEQMNGEEEHIDENMYEQEYQEQQGEEFEEQQVEENEEGQAEEYVNEEEYEQGGEEFEQEQDNRGEEQVDYDYKNEEVNDDNNEEKK